MKRILLFLLLVPFVVCAQDNSIYLAGAVPVEEGRVVFSKQIDLPMLSKSEVYDALLSWANSQFSDENNKVVYSDREKGQIAIAGKRYLVFSSSALSLDRSLMSYQVIIQCKDNACVIKISSLRYEYIVQNKRDPERYVAEELITDEHALHKDKLTRNTGKFRKGTIDFVEEIYQSAMLALGTRIISDGKSTSTVSESSATSVKAPVVMETTIERVAITVPATPVKDGFIVMEANKIPETLLNMLPYSTLKVSFVEDQQADVMEWKGIGNMFGKTTVMVLSPEGSLLEKSEVNALYILSFYKEAIDELPWLIMECVKRGEVQEGDQKMTIGEVLRVMIK